jgi:hypothetical protein
MTDVERLRAEQKILEAKTSKKKGDRNIKKVQEVERWRG